MNAALAPPVVDACLGRFARLMQVADAVYHANPRNPPRPMDIDLDDVGALFQSFTKHNVKFLLVGGWAVMFRGYVRATVDVDIWVWDDDANKERLITALAENGVVGAGHLRGVPLLFGWSSVRVGMSGFELDMGHSLKAFADTDFDACYDRAEFVSFRDVLLPMISLADLITEKRATGRARDLGDVDELIKIQSYITNHPDAAVPATDVG
jgi:hypothetical protein